MTTPIKVIIISILWLLYSLAAWQGCIRQCCLVNVDGTTSSVSDANNGAAVLPGGGAAERLPIDFKWSDPTAFTNNGFTDLKEKLLEGFSANSLLEITGFYHEGESQPDGFENMGLARAQKVAALFDGAIPTEQIRFHSRKVAENEAAKTGFFEGHDMKVSTMSPFDFKWGDASVNLNTGFVDFKNGFMAKMTDDNLLEITGLYYQGEPNPDGFENMGLARAASIKDLFKDVLPEDRIKMRARLIDSPDGTKYSYFNGYELKWIDAEKKVAQTVEELEDRIIIRFPYNSTEKDYDPEVDKYLVKLASRLKGSEEQVSLTGHTDNKGNADYNQGLGLNRANAIRAILLKNGVKASQIITDSKGQTQPVASNSTDEGRHDNRRVEVRYIKQ